MRARAWGQMGARGPDDGVGVESDMSRGQMGPRVGPEGIMPDGEGRG